MKNLYNVGLVVLVLVVLGCNCQRLKELADEGKTTERPTPVAANTSSSPSGTVSSSPATSAAGGLTLAKFNEIKDGMSVRDVNNLLGKQGELSSSTRGGNSKIETYKWQGNGFEYIFCNFTDDKLTFKTQANLK
ncbi:MAG TPA: hypothetical protein VIL74_09190 [Pyrinomonadaceae bacterium]|jgi:hypothetical protein